jgi:hypothetical protein
MTLKLLVADDAADVAEVVAFGAQMTWPNCQVTIASDGEQALQITERHIKPRWNILRHRASSIRAPS